jgi:hypothetical protein
MSPLNDGTVEWYCRNVRFNVADIYESDVRKHKSKRQASNRKQVQRIARDGYKRHKLGGVYLPTRGHGLTVVTAEGAYGSKEAV